VLAVLEAHGGLKLGMHDVYLNVAGGLRITEPAADLAAAAALISSLSSSPLPPDTVYFGEMGLSGAIRPVAQEQARLKEAAKLGFSNAVSPAPRVDKKAKERLPLPTSAIGHITDLVAGIAARRRKAS
jgi:DNA repair protein RadA/Sms